MHSSTVFKLSVYGFLAYCAFMLCVAQQALFPQILLILLVPVAYFLTEKHNLITLPTWAANTLGIIAVLFAILEFNGLFVPLAFLGDQYLTELPIRSGTNLIVYLCCIVLFLEKRTSYYWSILVFGVLMVALGCMFTNSIEYSVLLILFLVAGIWTLITFMIDEVQRQHYHPALAATASLPATAPESGKTPTSSRYNQRSSVKGTIKLEEGSHWYTRRLFVGFLVMCGLTFAISMCFYVMIPRTWVGNLRNLMTAEQKRMETGFDDKVRLGGIGALLDSSELVMQFELRDQNDQRVDLDRYVESLGYSEPYFRGNVLTTYENNTWREVKAKFGSDFADFSPLRSNRFVKQHIRMMSSPTGHVFAVYPAADFHVPDGIQQIPEFNRETNLWTLSSGNLNEFNLEVTLYDVAYQKLIMDTDFERPYIWQLTHRLPTQQEKIYRDALTLPDGLGPLVELAREIAKQSLQKHNMTLAEDGLLHDAPPEVVKQVVDDLTAYLLDEDNFTYSTDLTVADPTVDPVIDFLINTRQGHCEYFASSLTLMCRALNIPSRLVTGFKGAQKNNFDNLYYVKQSNAHAWVEVYINEGDQFDRWYVFDPTPFIDLDTRDFESTSSRSWGDFQAAVAAFWKTYVVNLTDQQRFEYIIKPIFQKLMQLWETIEERGLWELTKDIVSTILSPSYWFSSSGLVVIGFISLFVILLRKRLRPLLNWIRGLWGGQSKADLARQKTVYFNERFKQICKQKGLTKQRNQTDREFARYVQDLWRDYLQPHNLQDFPAQLNSWYYQIRFGNRQPEAEELKPINDQLARFEQEVGKIPHQPLPGHA